MTRSDDPRAALRRPSAVRAHQTVQGRTTAVVSALGGPVPKIPRPRTTRLSALTKLHAFFYARHALPPLVSP